MSEESRERKINMNAGITYVSLRQIACILTPGLLFGLLSGWLFLGDFKHALQIVLTVTASSFLTILTLNVMAAINGRGLCIKVTGDVDDDPLIVEDEADDDEDNDPEYPEDNIVDEEDDDQSKSGPQWFEMDYPDPDKELSSDDLPSSEGNTL